MRWLRACPIGDEPSGSISQGGRDMKNPAKKTATSIEPPAANTARKFISPNELSERWGCARTSVDRIARAAGMTRVLLGEGKNGMVRYLYDEVVAYEESRMVGPS
ncbi:hypothetical protein KI809_19145 [Geobacter pelophilus]|uniref:Helix-turn-helix domain-containing protein n=1 Tax=Geoanaerobacter pelophilus TaxID=60036 RepID=A0AAW4LCZ9_9BACT|nr:hypothetical protein [Geoanaerobacter pelophilus]MBT0666430.1 hypothetical protein [Geoanaerobacter pelophilus]